MPTKTPEFEGFVPPNDVAAEQAVLGACLIEKEAIDAIAGILTPADFYRENHALLLKTIFAVHGDGEPVDMVTVPAALGGEGLARIGGMAYLLALFDSVPSAANALHYAGIVSDHAIRRRAIAAGLNLIGQSRDMAVPPLESLNRTGQALQDLQAGRFTGQRAGLGTLMSEAYDRAEERANDPGCSGMLGLSTGLVDVDRMTSGLQSPDFIVLAARPSQGKTALVTKMIVEAAERGKAPALLFSLEMSRSQMATRIACMEASVDSHRLRTGRLDDHEWAAFSDATARLYRVPIDIDDSTNLTPMQAAAIIRQFQRDKGSVGLVAFDYIQLMSADEKCESMHQQVNSIVRGLKNLAREFQIPVIALSQLSRAVESRASRRPQLSDLRECVVGGTRLMDSATGKLVPIRDIQAGQHILAMDSRQKVRSFEVGNVWSTGIKPVFALKTRTGRGIIATANHPLLTAQGWKRVDELHPGDVIATAMRLPEHGVEKPDRGDLCRLLGYLAGNGTLQEQRCVAFCGSDAVIVQDAIDIVKGEFPDVDWHEKCWTNKYQEGSFICLQANGYGKPFGNPLREWLRSIGMIGMRTETKRVPDWVWESGKIGASQFLAGYLSTDGCVKYGNQKWTVHYDTVSRMLAEDTQLLLLRLGVVATVSDGYQSPKATRPLYRVTVAGFAENLRRFESAVKPCGRKGELLARMITELTEGVTNGSLFSLPIEVCGILSDKTKHLRQQGHKLAPGPRLYWRNGGRRPRRDICARFAESLKDEQLAVWAQSDLLWEEVKSIDPAGEEEVFDIVVPGCANFLANGIVAHNSGAIEAEADMVLFLYNAEIYARQEKAAAVTVSPGHRDTVELIVAKHRSGPTGVVKIGFQPVYTRFVNISQNGPDEQDAPPAPIRRGKGVNAGYDPTDEDFLGLGRTRPVRTSGASSGQRGAAVGHPAPTREEDMTWMDEVSQ